MGWPEIIFGVVLAGVVLAVAVLYIVRQLAALRRLRATEDGPSEERTYLHRRARRRLVTSVLLLLLGLMFVGALIWLEEPAHRLAEWRAAQEAQGELPPLSGEQRLFAYFFAGYWIVVLLLLMAVLFLVALDLLATRRYGLGQYRKLMADRRAMLEREVARLRRERNGHL